MKRPVSAKCFSMHNGRIILDLTYFEAPEKIKMKKRGGVDCEVSRRKRHFPNTFGPTIYQPTISNLHNRLSNQTNSAAQAVRIREPDSRKRSRTIFQQNIFF